MKVNKCLENSSYELKDKNLFKDELATFIYYLTLMPKRSLNLQETVVEKSDEDDIEINSR